MEMHVCACVCVCDWLFSMYVEVQQYHINAREKFFACAGGVFSLYVSACFLRLTPVVINVFVMIHIDLQFTPVLRTIGTRRSHTPKNTADLRRDSA